MDLYKTPLVHIVKPGTPGSIPILTQVGYTKGDPLKIRNVCEEGLKTSNHMKGVSEGTPCGAPDPNHCDYIYFRAPYFKPTESLDGKTIDEKIKLLYGVDRREFLVKNNGIGLVTIDVMPMDTAVFHSDERLNMQPSYWKHRHLLSEPPKFRDDGEILVLRPTIPPEWFSSCLVKIADFPKELSGETSNFLYKQPYPPSVKYNKDGTVASASKKLANAIDERNKEFEQQYNRYKGRIEWVKNPSVWKDVLPKGGKRTRRGKKSRKTRRR